VRCPDNTTGRVSGDRRYPCMRITESLFLLFLLFSFRTQKEEIILIMPSLSVSLGFGGRRLSSKEGSNSSILVVVVDKERMTKKS
jgi:hypothetical protein